MAITVSRRADPAVAQKFAKVISKARGTVIFPDEKQKLIEANKAKLRRYLDENPNGPKADHYREVLADLEKGIWHSDPSLKPGVTQTVAADAQVRAKIERYLRKKPDGQKAAMYRARLKELGDGD